MSSECASAEPMVSVYFFFGFVFLILPYRLYMYEIRFFVRMRFCMNGFLLDINFSQTQFYRDIL